MAQNSASRRNFLIGTAAAVGAGTMPLSVNALTSARPLTGFVDLADGDRAFWVWVRRVYVYNLVSGRADDSRVRSPFRLEPSIDALAWLPGSRALLRFDKPPQRYKPKRKVTQVIQILPPHSAAVRMLETQFEWLSVWRQVAANRHHSGDALALYFDGKCHWFDGVRLPAGHEAVRYGAKKLAWARVAPAWDGWRAYEIRLHSPPLLWNGGRHRDRTHI